MESVTTISPGKCILFGEHAVVYGYSAIATAISLYSSCTISKSDHETISVNLENYDKIYEFMTLNELASSFPEQFNQIRYLFMSLHNKFNLNFNNIKITLKSSIMPGSGLGSSASTAVALVSAFNEFYGLNLDKQGISEVAFEMEKIVHGSPSGIDNTICTFGNSIIFQNGTYKFLKMHQDLKFIITDTNIEHDTKLAINEIKTLREEDPKFVNNIFRNIGKLSKAAKRELIKGNKKHVGELMNRNQNYLSSLRLVNQEISKVINTARMFGALGSKLTGAGLGGCVITICKDKKIENIISQLDKQGFKSYLTKIDNQGVRIEKKE